MPPDHIQNTRAITRRETTFLADTIRSMRRFLLLVDGAEPPRDGALPARIEELVDDLATERASDPDALPDPTAGEIVLALGLILGERFVAEGAGRWHMDDLAGQFCVKMPSGRLAYPVARVAARLEDRSVSLSAYATAVLADAPDPGTAGG